MIRQQVEIIDGMLGDAYFDYDQYRLRADAVDALREAARLLAKALETQPGARLLVEGHCDERGSSPYNLALGDARAQKVREFLGDVGLPASRIDTVSYGEDRPECTDSTEACWQRNRRAHLRYSNPTP
ncbi:MAG: OmpA family protein [Bryobacteraceae bacterium]